MAHESTLVDQSPGQKPNAETLESPATAIKSEEGNWYGPHGQFYPHRMLFALIIAPLKAIFGTLAGILNFIMHPIRSVKELWYGITHIDEILRGIGERARVSLRKNGVVFTVVSIICMVVLPGAGLFGKVAGVTQDIRKSRKQSVR